MKPLGNAEMDKDYSPFNLIKRAKHNLTKRYKPQPETNNQVPSLSAKDENDAQGDLIDIWSKQVDIVIHFSDVNTKIRLYAISILVTLVTLISTITQVTTNTLERAAISRISFLALCIAWFITWMIDRSYYSKLYGSSVSELMDLENRISTEQTVPGSISPKSGIKLKIGKLLLNSPDLFYILPQMLLLTGFLASCYELSLHDQISTDPSIVHIQKAERKAASSDVGLYIFNRNESLELNEVVVEVSTMVVPKYIADIRPYRQKFRIATKLPPLSKSQLIIIDSAPLFKGEYRIEFAYAKTSPFIEDATKKMDLQKIFTGISNK